MTATVKLVQATSQGCVAHRITSPISSRLVWVHACGGTCHASKR